jgi:type III secretion protein Q
MTTTTSTMRNSGATGTARAENALRHQARPAPAPETGLALPVVSPAEAAFINAFYCHRPAVTFPVAGHKATIAALWPPAPGEDSGRCQIDLVIDGAPGALTLPVALIKGLIAGLDPDQGLDDVDPRQRALLLELAVADALSALEVSLGSRLSIDAVYIDAVCTGGSQESGTVSLAFNLAINGLASGAAELRLPPPHAARFAQSLDRGAPASSRAGGGSEGAATGVPVAVCLRTAATTCSVGEIATLSPGDIVTADFGQQWPTAVAVIAEHLAAPVELTNAGAQIMALPAHIRGSSWEWSMESGADGLQTDLMQKTGLDDIPVKLLFELGRVELSLAEIRRLAPGVVIAMPRPLDESVEIVANGRRIGRGSLIQIGSNLGVRITRLFQDV